MVSRDRKNFVVQKPQLGVPRFIWEKVIEICSKKMGKIYLQFSLRKYNG